MGATPAHVLSWPETLVANITFGEKIISIGLESFPILRDRPIICHNVEGLIFVTVPGSVSDKNKTSPIVIEMPVSTDTPSAKPDMIPLPPSTIHMSAAVLNDVALASSATPKSFT